jgi:hypothetical protein
MEFIGLTLPDHVPRGGDSKPKYPKVKLAPRPKLPAKRGAAK